MVDKKYKGGTTLQRPRIWSHYWPSLPAVKNIKMNWKTNLKCNIKSSASKVISFIYLCLWGQPMDCVSIWTDEALYGPKKRAFTFQFPVSSNFDGDGEVFRQKESSQLLVSLLGTLTSLFHDWWPKTFGFWRTYYTPYSRYSRKGMSHDVSYQSQKIQYLLPFELSKIKFLTTQ